MDGDMSTMPIIFGSVFAVFFVGIVGCGCWRKWKEGGNNYALMPAQPVVGAYQSQHSPVYPYSQGAASPQPALSGAETGPTDFFISHTQRNGAATTIATDLYSSLKEEGMAVWFDVKMEDRSSAAMQRGVENSSCVIAIITGPVTNPDCPEDLPAQNAYFARPFCVNELRWAKAAGIPIQPVIRSADKTRIGELMAAAPEDLQDLINTDFITVDRSDLDYWKVGVQKIMRAANKVSRSKSNSSSGGPPQSPPVATYMPPSGTYVPPPPQYQPSASVSTPLSASDHHRQVHQQIQDVHNHARSGHRHAFTTPAYGSTARR
eukprot:m.41925 g.41925  ORF g.41925 m.41925 type:complete len:319 (+) comp6197_c0_seq1:42-998(+)